MLSVIEEEILVQKDKERGQDQTSDSPFAQLIDQYDYQLPKRGQILEGEVETIGDDAIILDVGLKRAAIVPKREISNMEDEDIAGLTIGDVIPIQVTQTPIGDKDLIVSLENALELQSWKNAKALLKQETVVELEVIGSNKGGLLVAYERLEAFIPNSHIPGLRRTRSREKINQKKREMMGEHLKAKILEVDPERQRLIFSVIEARKSQRQERLNTIEVGDVINGIVVGVVRFGLFVDLDGIDGLVHVSELDWLDVRHPGEIASEGDEMQVEVIGIDRERERVELSRKTLLPNPWEKIETKYVPGDLVKVEIVKVVDFGAFARLPEGIHGLIHRTKLGYTAPGMEGEVVKAGMEVLVKILRINPERERIALSMSQVPIEKQLDWMLDEYEDELG